MAMRQVWCRLDTLIMVVTGINMIVATIGVAMVGATKAASTMAGTVAIVVETVMAADTMVAIIMATAAKLFVLGY